MEYTELVPVSEWQYDLYRVSYWTGVPDAGGKLIKTVGIAASSESHLHSTAIEAAPRDDCWMDWVLIKENVGHPRVIGNLYNQNIYENSLTHGERLLEER